MEITPRRDDFQNKIALAYYCFALPEACNINPTVDNPAASPPSQYRAARPAHPARLVGATAQCPRACAWISNQRPNTNRALSSPPKTVPRALSASPKRTHKCSLNFQAQQQCLRPKLSPVTLTGARGFFNTTSPFATHERRFLWHIQVVLD